MQIPDQLPSNISLSLIIFLLIAIPLHFIYGLWKRTDLSTEAKVLWMIFFVAAPVFSIIIYLAFGNKKQSNP